MKRQIRYSIYYFSIWNGFLPVRIIIKVVQKSALLFLISFSAISLLVLSQLPNSETKLEAVLDNSVPYVGGDYPISLGYDGTGIVIGVIDTGVDSTHPDLNGVGPNGKIIKSYNFFDDNESLDVNGHGTEVAGIIAADGNLQGIAPKAKIISYKVSDDGESVSSDLIIKAIEQAIVDEVDIINISLGVNRTNSQIDSAVDKAVKQGIVVVAAAGNDGPNLETIGSPGLNQNAITVGATYNNLTSSLVATLEVDGKQFQALPMVATPSPELPITAKVMFGDYSRERDFEKDDFRGAIVLAERGSDVEDEIVYFSDKENYAANADAAALIVYNNEPGIYLGELIHEYIPEDYYPRIPTVSISREDGLQIRSMMLEPLNGTLHIFYNPDFVVHFSSRGPVSPFYIKPDLVAPGAFVNTTLNDGKYNFTSGTSFATPHVSGTVALLLQKNPDLTPQEIKSILVTTTDSVSDAYGTEFGFESAGSGRLNVTKVFDANLVISPSYLSFDLAPDKKSDQDSFELNPINGNVGEIDVTFDVPEIVEMNYQKQNNAVIVSAELVDEVFGEFGGRVKIADEHTSYNVPILFRSTQGSISAIENNGKIDFQVNQPENWTYAKISIINSETGKTDTTSARPDGENDISVYQNGTYWIEAKIDSNGKTIDAFEKVQVNNAIGRNQQLFTDFEIPERQIIIIAAIVIIIGIVGFSFRRT